MLLSAGRANFLSLVISMLPYHRWGTRWVSFPLPFFLRYHFGFIITITALLLQIHCFIPNSPILGFSSRLMLLRLVRYHFLLILLPPLIVRPIILRSILLSGIVRFAGLVSLADR